MIAAIKVTKFQPVIDHVLPLEELAAAFRYQEQGIHFSKISIDIA
jgi:NADPH:quinone reductase-like Zn-dependent oxidoreductase